MSRFKLKDEKDQKRLTELERVEDGLESQMALADLITEWAVNDKSLGLANALLNTRGKLMIQNEASKVRANELLSKSALSAFMQQISAVITQEVAKLPISVEAQNAFIDSVHGRLADAMAKGAKNTESKG